MICMKLLPLELPQFRSQIYTFCQIFSVYFDDEKAFHFKLRLPFSLSQVSDTSLKRGRRALQWQNI